MANHVVNGAMMSCSFGAAPATLIVLPAHMCMSGMQPAANVNDFIPITNIPTFGMCSSLSNPTVASATSAALGVLTPMPCIPATASPWSPGSATVNLDNAKVLNNSSTCKCSYGGSISLSMAGETTENVP